MPLSSSLGIRVHTRGTGMYVILHIHVDAYPKFAFENLLDRTNILIDTTNFYDCSFFRIKMWEAIKVYPNTCVMETCKLHDPRTHILR